MLYSAFAVEFASDTVPTGTAGADLPSVLFMLILTTDTITTMVEVMLHLGATKLVTKPEEVVVVTVLKLVEVIKLHK